MRGRTAGVAALGVLAWFVGSFARAAAAEPPLFLVDSTFDGARTRVFSVEPGTGALALLADLGKAFTPVLGMAAANGRDLYLAGSDTSGEDRCLGARSCLLVHVRLGEVSAFPEEIREVDVIRTEAGPVLEVVGLAFGPDGTLFASSQATSALYAVDVDTAAAREIGPFGLVVDGGDVTFDDEGRLLLWNNLGDQAGLYDVDPKTGRATVFELHPGLGFAGMAALGHSRRILGASPPEDLLYEIDAVVGLERAGARLTLDGSRFDHKRGDLDSPWCVDDASCDDGDPCTSDRCTPGGCSAVAEDADADGVADCFDRCPGTSAGAPVTASGCSVAQACPCESAWPNHGAYVSCVAAAAEETGEGGAAMREAARSDCGTEAPPPRRPSPRLPVDSRRPA